MTSFRLLIGGIFAAFSLVVTPIHSHAEDLEDSMRYAQGLSSAFQNAADKIGPSVVNISSVSKPKVIKQNFGGTQPPRGSPFDEFFGQDFLEKLFPFQDPGQFGQQGLGTGVIIDNDGNILTNNHVVEGADEITVKLSDKRELKAELVGTDPKTDLAVIRIKSGNLTAAKLGDSDLLQIGEWVVACGNPFGLDHTITAGIVSAKGRSNMGIVDYEDFIQTDAAINPGNSGGPLLNLRGEVVGINAAIFSKSGGSMGIGFAIPINMAKAIMASLIDDGKVVRGWLGVAIQNLDEDLAASFDFHDKGGILIGGVTEGGPASKSGLVQGDIVTKFNGKSVTDVNQFRTAVAATKPGESMKLEVLRQGQTKNISVKVGEMDTEAQVASIGKPSRESNIEIGVKVQDLTPNIAEQLGIQGARGVVVVAVQPGSIAANVGLRPSDVIIDVNGTKTTSVDLFRKAVAKGELSKGIRLIVQSGEFQRYVLLKQK